MTGPFSRPFAAYTGAREEMMGDLSISPRCQNCGKAFQAKQDRARFCGDPCRWAAWKQEREKKARAPVERALRTLLTRVEQAVQEAREAMGGWGE